MEIINILYLVFIFVSLYVSFLFLILFFKNKKNLFYDEIPKTLPFISVLIPAYNEEDTIAGTINAVQNSNYPKKLLEIIVINDGSKDNTLNIAEEIAKKDKRIKVFTKENEGSKASALNFGLKKTKGKFIAVVDADSYPEKNSILKMVHYFKDKKVAAVTSVILVRNPKKLIEKLQAIEYTIIAWARKLMGYIGSVFATPGPLSIYRKDSLLKVGSFNTKVLTEDIEITWNLLKHRYKTKMCLSARTYTAAPNNFKSWWKQRNRWNIGGIQTVNLYKNTFLNKKYGMLGFFILPFFISFYILSLVGFSIYVFLASRIVIKSFLITKYTYLTKISLWKILPISFIPTVFTFFLASLFVVSLVYSLYALKTISQRTKINLKGGLYLFIYLVFYLLLYPTVLVHSIYKLITHNIVW